MHWWIIMPLIRWCIYIRMHSCGYIHTYIYTFIHIYIDEPSCHWCDNYIYAYAFMCIYTCIHLYIYIYIHIYTCIHWCTIMPLMRWWYKSSHTHHDHLYIYTFDTSVIHTYIYSSFMYIYIDTSFIHIYIIHHHATYKLIQGIHVKIYVYTYTYIYINTSWCLSLDTTNLLTHTITHHRPAHDVTHWIWRWKSGLGKWCVCDFSAFS